MKRFKDSLLELIIETSSRLAPDVRQALRAASAREGERGLSAMALRTIGLGVERAAVRRLPICADTGMLTFEVKVPPEADQLAMCEAIGEAVAEATRRGILRANSVDPLIGVGRPDNLGPGMPLVHFEQWLSDQIEVRLLLRGGGADNVSAQYTLPCELRGWGRVERDFGGIRGCVLHAVHEAQGLGCGPGILGVGVGGDRASSEDLAKQQLFRPLDDVNPDRILARFEGELVDEANTLGIGAMGLGGRVTLLGCKIGLSQRLSSSYFVTVAYNCWALRRLGIVVDARTGAIVRWLYEDALPVAAGDPGLSMTGREVHLTTPLGEDDVRSLAVGDVVRLSGVLYMAADAVHRHLATHESPVDLRGAALLHCSPVVVREGDAWRLTAVGPTTSLRQELYQSDVLRRCGIRAVIGKGGMGPRTLAALEYCGAVYLSAVGGAAQVHLDHIVAVEGPHLLELGASEALWRVRVEGFPAVVTMDAHGHNLHAQIEARSAEAFAQKAAPLEV
jgi:fumarate hydratase class I